MIEERETQMETQFQQGYAFEQWTEEKLSEFGFATPLACLTYQEDLYQQEVAKWQMDIVLHSAFAIDHLEYQRGCIEGQRVSLRNLMRLRGDEDRNASSSPKLSPQEKVCLRQLTLHQVRSRASGERLIVRLALQSEHELQICWLAHDTVVLKTTQRKRKGPRIARIFPMQFYNYAFEERSTTRARGISWVAEEGSLEDGTFFMIAEKKFLLQLFAFNGEGRMLAEIERTWKADMLLRVGSISFETYTEMLMQYNEEKNQSLEEMGVDSIS